jgi:hypothetical protein
MDREAARRPERAPTLDQQGRTSDAIWPGTNAFTLAPRPGTPKDVQASFRRRPISLPSVIAGPRRRGVTRTVDRPGREAGPGRCLRQAGEGPAKEGGASFPDRQAGVRDSSSRASSGRRLAQARRAPARCTRRSRGAPVHLGVLVRGCEHGGAYVPESTVGEGERIAAVTWFGDRGLLARFGRPRALREQPRCGGRSQRAPSAGLAACPRPARGGARTCSRSAWRGLPLRRPGGVPVQRACRGRTYHGPDEVAAALKAAAGWGWSVRRRL